MKPLKIKIWLSGSIILLYFLWSFHSALAIQTDHEDTHSSHSTVHQPGDSSDHAKDGSDKDKPDVAKHEKGHKKGDAEHQHIHPTTSTEVTAGSGKTPVVGVNEQLGKAAHLQATFIDEKGNAAKLGDVIDKPTLLLPVYYHCPMACDIMMANLAAALNQVTLKAGEDYHVLSVSFDDEDTPAVALDSKFNYTKILNAEFPKTAWNFLTGDASGIKQLTESAGYQFKKTGQHTFVHPNALIVLSHDGKIIRYLYGPEFLPFDISMALTEATKGTPSVSIKKLLTYCFDYDPKGKKYVFKTFRILGSVIFVTLGLFYFLVLRKGKRSRRGSNVVKGESHEQ